MPSFQQKYEIRKYGWHIQRPLKETAPEAPDIALKSVVIDWYAEKTESKGKEESAKTMSHKTEANREAAEII